MDWDNGCRRVGTDMRRLLTFCLVPSSMETSVFQTTWRRIDMTSFSPASSTVALLTLVCAIGLLSCSQTEPTPTATSEATPTPEVTEVPTLEPARLSTSISTPEAAEAPTPVNELASNLRFDLLVEYFAHSETLSKYESLFASFRTTYDAIDMVCQGESQFQKDAEVVREYVYRFLQADTGLRNAIAEVRRLLARIHGVKNSFLLYVPSYCNQ